MIIPVIDIAFAVFVLAALSAPLSAFAFGR